ncbi:MAG: ABC transporter substrate-binding protein [Clostridia bacterium]|nr:ABC transporter substrate-binding protein [Clostridia bacterium]
MVRKVMVVLLAFVVMFSASAAFAADTFLIGTYLQLTGGNAVVGNSGKQGIDLAVKYINEHGGFNGATVVVKHYDTTGSTEEAVKVVQKMLVDDAVDAVVGSINSNEVSACIPYLNEAEIYNFGLGTSATWMADTSRIWTFRASANNGRIAPQGVDISKKFGHPTVAIINGTDDTGRSTADAFEEACKEKGVTVTAREQCDSGDTDFTGQITRIMASNPDSIYMSLIGTTFGPFVKQLRNMGYTGMLGCKECFSLEYMSVAGVENSDYIFFAYPYVAYTDINDCDIPIMKEFLDRFYAEFKALPAHEGAYRGWDTMMTMWEATKIAGKNDKTALRDATHKVKIPGLGGQLDFTKGDREGYSEFYEFILVDGKNIILDEWLASGGYDAYKKATGRNR